MSKFLCKLGVHKFRRYYRIKLYGRGRIVWPDFVAESCLRCGYSRHEHYCEDGYDQ